MHEGIPILNFLVPKAFTHEDGKLTGVAVREGRSAVTTTRAAASWCRPASRTSTIECDDVLVADRPGERLPLDRARHRHRVRRVGHAGGRRDRRCSRRSPSVFFGGDAAFGPEEHHLGRRARPRGGDLDRQASATARTSATRPPPGVTLVSPEDGHPRVELRQRHLAATSATRCRCATQAVALQNVKVEVELGFDRALGYAEAQRCLNCDVQTVFADDAVHRVRRLRRHLPDGLHHLHRQRRGGDLRTRLQRAGART